MKKILLMLTVVCFLFTVGVSTGYAATVTLQWNPVSGATDYCLQYRDTTITDAGWTGDTTVSGAVSYSYPNVPESGLVLFRIGAGICGSNTIWNAWQGAWYDHTLKPEYVRGLGVQ